MIPLLVMTLLGSATPEPAASEKSASERLVCIGIGEAWWQDFENQAILEIGTSSARVKPPERILPPARGGDNFGWWPIRNLSMTDAELRGSVRMNLINKPSVRFDRRTNELTFKGMAGSFRGRCRPASETQSVPSVADELAKFAKLRADGVLTEAEFQEQKAKLLGGSVNP